MTAQLARSIQARLKQRATASGEDYELLLTRFGLERLLYRLSQSAHAPQFLLKGALLFALWYDAPLRPTRDVDLLGFGADDTDSALAVFRDVCALPIDDGLRFDLDSIRATVIRKQAGYAGVRVEINATLERARIKLQVDIGYGDAVTPAAQAIAYPVLLDGFPAALLRAYPMATVVAEKFQAICALGLANTRMKDYFDLWALLQRDDLVTTELAAAIAATCQRRGTALPDDWPMGLSDAFADAG